jgi:capsular polysaccharide transport system permease protein
MDLLLAGAFLEVISSCCMVITLLGILAIFGIDFMPHDVVKAASAFGAALLLGFGCGIVNTAIAMAVPTWVTGYTLLTVVLYLISGIFFLPDALPEGIRYYLSFNPTLQIVEWMRAAYYDGYGSMLAPNYTLAFGATMLFAGLVVERVFRGQLLLAK